MAENNNIDDLFRKGIESFRMDPPESSWNSLQGKLAKKRAARIRRRWLGWFSASLLLLTLSYTSYRHFTSKTPEEPVIINSNSEKISENHKQLNERLENALGKKSETNKESISEDHTSMNDKLEKALGKKGSSTSSTISNSESVTSNTPSSQNNSSSQNKNSVASTSSVKSDDKVSSEKNVNTADTKKQQSTAKNDNKKAAAAVSASAISVKKNTPKSTPETGINSTSTSSATSTSTSSPPASNTNATSQNVTEPESATNNSNSQDKNVIAADEKNPAGSEKENSQNKIAAAVVVSSQAPLQNSGQSSVPKSDYNSAATPDNNKSNDMSPSPVAINTVPQDSAKTNNDSGQAPANPQTPRDSSISRFKKVISLLSADIYYSPDWVNSRYKPNDTYTGTASQDPADYADQKSEFSYSAGFHVGVDVTKQWSIRSGVSFSTFNQSAVYNTLQVVADSVYQEEHDHGGGYSGGHSGGGHHHHDNHNHQPPNQNNDHHYVVHTPCGTIDLHHEPETFSNGSQTAVNGSSFNIKTETNQTIHFIYIPLLVRYQFGQKKLSYFVEGGAALNLVRTDVVKVTVNDSYTEENNFDGLNSFNYSLLFGAGVQYNFYKRMNFFLKPSLRYSITPINDTNPLYSYPYYIGLGTGFSIHF